MNLAELERQYGLPQGLLGAVANTENATGDSNAVSPKGAIGTFQFMPSTAAQYGVDPRDPAQSAVGAAKYYRDLLAKYGGDVTKAMAAYNWGPGNLDKYGMDRAPTETRNYIRKVSAGMDNNNAPGSADAAMAWLRKQGYVSDQTPAGDATGSADSAMAWLRKQGYVAAPTEAVANTATAEPHLARSAAAGFNRGALTGLPGLPVDTALNVWDLAKAAYGSAGKASGFLKTEDMPQLTERAAIPGSSEWIARKIRDAGGAPMIDNPSPDNPLARNLYSAGDFAAQAMLTKGALDRAPAPMLTRAPGVPQMPPSTIASNLENAKSAAQAAASGFVGNAVGEATGNPNWGMVASFAPNAAGIAPSTARIIGGAGSEASRRNLAQRAQDFKAAGIDAGVGLAKDNWLTQWLQQFAANTPGGSYVMDKTGRDVQAQMGQRVADLVAQTSPEFGPRAAGNAVTQAAQDYRTRQQAIYRQMDTRANELLPPNNVVPVTNFAGRFNTKFAPIPGAPATSEALTGPLGGAYKLGQSLLADSAAPTTPTQTAKVGGQTMALVQTPTGFKLAPVVPNASQAVGGVPYSALSAIKSRMGDLAFPQNPLLADANQGALKHLYGGLAADQRAAAQAAGPSALAARNRANTFYSATQAKLENILAPLAKGGDVVPGDVFDRITENAGK